MQLDLFNTTQLCNRQMNHVPLHANLLTIPIWCDKYCRVVIFVLLLNLTHGLVQMSHAQYVDVILEIITQ